MLTNVAPVIRAGIEHDRLERLLREVDEVASHLGGNPGPGCIRRAGRLVDSLTPMLLGHLSEEEDVVYPATFSDEYRVAVDLLILDHEAIRGALGQAGRAATAAEGGRGHEDCEPLRRALIALVTLVRAHHDKESFLYLRATDGADGPHADD